MEGGNLREDAPETFENRFNLHTIFLHHEEYYVFRFLLQVENFDTLKTLKTGTV